MDTSGCQAKFLEAELRRILPAKLVNLCVLLLALPDPLRRSLPDPASPVPATPGGSASSSRSTSRRPGSRTSRRAPSASTSARSSTTSTRNSSSARATRAAPSRAASASARSTCPGRARVRRPSPLAPPSFRRLTRARFAPARRGRGRGQDRPPSRGRGGHDAGAYPVRPSVSTAVAQVPSLTRPALPATPTGNAPRRRASRRRSRSRAATRCAARPARRCSATFATRASLLHAALQLAHPTQPSDAPDALRFSIINDYTHFSRDPANYSLPEDKKKCPLWDDLGERTEKELREAREKAKEELRAQGVDVDEGMGASPSRCLPWHMGAC